MARNHEYESDPSRDHDARKEGERARVLEPTGSDHEDIEEARWRAHRDDEADADRSYDDMILDDDELDLDRMAEPQGPDA